MKRLLFLSISILLLFSCSELKSRLDNLEDRVAKLEQQCSRMNSDIEALRAIVSVLDQADFIKTATSSTGRSAATGCSTIPATASV